MIVGAVALVVAVIVGVALASSGGEPIAAKPSAAPSPNVKPPVGLTAATKPVPIGVTLTWGPPRGKAKVLGYLILRNGTQIGSVPSDTTTYQDLHVTPGETYTYGVLTRGDGFLKSERASMVVEVPIPPISLARLDGFFDVTAKTVSQSGYISKLGKLSLGWGFRPTCHTGPCSARWSDLTSDSLGAVLARKGRAYSGTDEGKFIGRCGRVQLTSTVRIKIRVTKAEVVVGEWRATKLVGTLKATTPSRFGCVSGAATFLITATLAD